MNTQRLLIVLTLANFALLIFSLAHPGVAAESGVAVLRGRALEIVDDRGRVRAGIAVWRPDPAVKMPDGRTEYQETVLLGLISSNGAPNVKLAAVENGAGLVL